MYGIYLIYDWCVHHPIWTGLGVFVLVGTVVTSWLFDRSHLR